MNDANPHRGRHGRKPPFEQIAMLAYAIYEREGCPEGRAWEHWFNAETMMESQFGQGEDHAEADLGSAASEE